MDVSYGASLPDSETIVNAHTDALIQLLPTAAAFIQVRSQLEREYSKKLSEAAAKARLQAIKEATDRTGTGKGTNTVETAYLKLIESADWDAREALHFADTLQTQVVDALHHSHSRLDAIRKKQHAFAAKLLSERDRSYGERDKAKQKYFDACETLEAARQKKATAKDDRATDKAVKAYDLAMDDMLIAKNTFLLSTDTANVHKLRLYNQDLPAAHDDFQLVEAQTLRTLTHHWHLLTALQRTSLHKRGENVGIAEGGIAAVSVEQDQGLFVEAHSGRVGTWEVPRDLEFEECPVWHDSAEMSTDPAPAVYLQNVKIKALAKVAEISPVIESKRREVAGLRNLRDAYEKDRNLGDVGSVLENLIDSAKDLTLLEGQQSELKAQIEVISATLGDDDGPTLKLHKFSNKSFVTPVTCAVCESNLWGKGRICSACGCSVHTKCELKVPAGCGSTAGKIVRTPTHSRKPSTASRNTASVSSPASSSGASSFSVPPPRSLPPTGAPSSSSQPTATMLYDYSAATAFELSLSNGDVVTVVEPEDDAGWTKVATADGREGLVPASYLQLGGARSGAAATPAAEGDGEQLGAEIVALYAYTASGEDELSVAEGERLNLTSVGLDYGNNWAEAVNSAGQKGLVPGSYIELV